VSDQLHKPAALLPGKQLPSYTLDRRLGGHKSRSGRGGEGKIFQTLSGPEPPIIRLVVQRYTTELSRLPSWAGIIIIIIIIIVVIIIIIIIIISVTGNQRRERGSIPGRSRNYFFPNHAQIDPEAHKAS
jgi:hypothetical protein